jgi:ornithine--oxo-acid transaminase
VVKKIPENKAEIIVADGNFHGRTTTIIGFSSEASYKKNFGPFTPGFVSVPFGDLKAIEAAITPNTCAVMMEPIQGEAGIVVPKAGFLSGLRKLCTEKKVLMIMDEVQSGLGRTGKMFAFQHENAVPDGLILGKALGGGVLPVSALVGSAELMGLLTQLRGINSPLIREVRGRGLWIGVDFDPKHISARKVCEMMMVKGVLSKETHETIVRFAPPLVISKEQVDWAINVLREVIRDAETQTGAGA